MNAFQHIILTRFNVPTEKWDTTKAGKKPLTEEWLEERFKLFMDYSLPSFKNQSQKNFSWLVFFDVNTPERFRQKIEHIQQDFPTFQPVFVEDFNEMKQKTVELGKSLCSPETKYIISAEIDNDDLLEKDYLKISQDLFRPVHDLVLDLRRGYQMTVLNKKNVLLNEYYVVANAFVGIIEEKEKFQSILKGNHRFYRDYKNITVYDKKPLFIQTIHQNNLMNDLYHTKFYYSVDMGKDFGLPHLKVNAAKSFLKNIKHYTQLIVKKLKR